jgi:hypothetical protein
MIQLQNARRIIAAAQHKAEEIGQHMNVGVRPRSASSISTQLNIRTL